MARNSSNGGCESIPQYYLREEGSALAHARTGGCRLQQRGLNGMVHGRRLSGCTEFGPCTGDVDCGIKVRTIKHCSQPSPARLRLGIRESFLIVFDALSPTTAPQLFAIWYFASAYEKTNVPWTHRIMLRTSFVNVGVTGIRLPSSQPMFHTNIRKRGTSSTTPQQQDSSVRELLRGKQLHHNTAPVRRKRIDVRVRRQAFRPLLRPR